MTRALSGGCRYSPTISRTFSTNSGSADSLNVSVRCGCRPKARQMRCTVLRLTPLVCAMARVLQWVACFDIHNRTYQCDVPQHCDSLLELAAAITTALTEDKGVVVEV